MKLFIIDGQIASGKSSLLRNLDEFVKNHPHLPYNVISVNECLEKYENFKGHNPLSLAYHDPARNAAVNQLYIIEIINKHLQDTLYDKLHFVRRKDHYDDKKEHIVVVDRSLYSPLVFSRLLFKDGIISEFVYDFLRTKSTEEALKTMCEYGLNPVGVLLLYAGAEECLQRIKKRGRTYEIEHITADYLRRLEDEYREHAIWWSDRVRNNGVTEIDTQATDQNVILKILLRELNKCCRCSEECPCD
jgi:deoxyadenosine/deoxycytidine kinase